MHRIKAIECQVCRNVSYGVYAPSPPSQTVQIRSKTFFNLGASKGMYVR